MNRQILFTLLMTIFLGFSSCNKEEEIEEQTDLFSLTFRAEHNGVNFKGHYRFLIKDSNNNYKYDKQDYVQNNSVSMTTEARKGDKVFIYANNPQCGDTCIVSCKSSDGSVNLKVIAITTATVSDSLVL